MPNMIDTQKGNIYIFTNCYMKLGFGNGVLIKFRHNI